VLDHGGYSDSILALGLLWLVIITALIEWPSSRTPVLSRYWMPWLGYRTRYIKVKLPTMMENNLTGNGFLTLRCIGLVTYSRAKSAQCPDEASLRLARRLYLRIKDLEAQLLAKHIMGMSRQVAQYIIRSLEKTIDHSDSQIAPNEAAAYTQVKLDFHIPAISYMFMYNGHEIFDQVVRDGLRDLTPYQMPDAAMEFENGAERWSFWKRRLGELAHDASDDEVKTAAAATIEYMI
jgi:hypothetical protein